MRLVVWNCRMGLAKKHGALASLKPDIAVVPEAGDPASPKLAAVAGSAKAWAWVGPNPNKGLAAFAFGRYGLEATPRSSRDRPDALAVRVAGPVPFTLVAVWTRGPKYIQNLHHVVDAWGPLLHTGDVVLAGDFNSNTIWDKLHGDRCHSTMVRRLESEFGLESAYHVSRQEAHGAESEQTFFMYGRDKFTYHIDYVFLPRAWRDRVRSVSIESGPTWRNLSDHAALTVEIAE